MGFSCCAQNTTSDIKANSIFSIARAKETQTDVNWIFYFLPHVCNRDSDDDDDDEDEDDEDNNDDDDNGVKRRQQTEQP